MTEVKNGTAGFSVQWSGKIVIGISLLVAFASREVTLLLNNQSHEMRISTLETEMKDLKAIAKTNSEARIRTEEFWKENDKDHKRIEGTLQDISVVLQDHDRYFRQEFKMPKKISDLPTRSQVEAAKRNLREQSKRWQ